MSGEHNRFEKKCLRKVLGSKADWLALTESCVAFATAVGGTIAVGIEDDAINPPVSQTIPKDLPDSIRRRIRELTVNVSVEAEVCQAENGASFIEVQVPRVTNVPSTTSGRFYLREGDRNRPIVGDEVLRLASDRATFSWELLTALGVRRSEADVSKLAAFVTAIRASDRVKATVKEKSDSELMDHYLLAQGSLLTNLGIFLRWPPRTSRRTWHCAGYSVSQIR